MALTPGPFCSQCGTPLQGSQRFCTNCGATIEMHANSPTIAASPPAPTVPAQGQTNSAGETAQAATPPTLLPGGPVYSNRNDALLPPPPPPPIYNPYTNSGPGEQRSYAQTTVPDAYTPPPIITPPAQAGAYQVPAYAQKPKGKRGCATTSIVLLLVLALGIGGYFLVHTLTNHNTANNNTGSTGTATSGTSGNTATNTATATTHTTTPTSSTSAANTVQLNLQFTYASIGITLISTQLANSFADDTSTTAGSAGIVRVNLRENNPTVHNPDYLEGDSFVLLLPGGTTAQAGNAKVTISPDGGVNRLNWLDFPLTNQVALNQLTLRVGTASQSQFEIPLQANADLSKYQDKTSSPNAQFKYGSLNMTLKTATLSYSYSDNQATTGNRYVIVTLAAVNNTANSVDVYPNSDMRLQAGGNSIEPDNIYTFPYTVNANTSASGIVAFLVPQDTTSFTLVMIAQPSASPAISQATQTFQVQ